MKTFVDMELQARLIREMRELYEKRGRLEAGIRAVDTARTLRIEKDALLDIEAYRTNTSRFPMTERTIGLSRFRRKRSGHRKENPESQSA